MKKTWRNLLVLAVLLLLVVLLWDQLKDFGAEIYNAFN